jgi:iron(III) transport system substrate-binding protein
LTFLLSGCDSALAQPNPAGTVPACTARDRGCAARILGGYAQRTAVHVLPRFTVESTKSVGLTNVIIVAAARPRCALFWNNEILNTIRLKEKGLLIPVRPAHAEALPDTFQAKDGAWYRFADRARAPLVHTGSVPRGRPPAWNRSLGQWRPGAHRDGVNPCRIYG